MFAFRPLYLTSCQVCNRSEGRTWSSIPPARS